MATFNSVGDSLIIYATPRDVVSYTLDDTGGTFAGNIRMMRSERDSGSDWTTITDITDGDQDGTWTNNTGKDQYIKLLVTAYSGDATVATLTLSTDDAGHIVVSGNKLVSSEGSTLMSFSGTDGTFGGGLTVAGTLTAQGNLDLSGGLTLPTSAAITAYATGGQANGTAIAAGETANITTCATAGDSVKLTEGSTVGSRTIIKNSGAESCNVFPPTDGTIDGGSADAAVALGAGQSASFIEISANAWISALSRAVGRSYAFSERTVAADLIEDLAQTDLVVGGTWSSLSASSDFTVATSSCRITYTGTQTKLFEVSGWTGFSGTTTAAVIIVGIAVSGTRVTTKQDVRAYHFGASDQYAHPVCYLTELSTNDYVEIVYRRLSGTGDLYEVTGALFVKELAL